MELLPNGVGSSLSSVACSRCHEDRRTCDSARPQCGACREGAMDRGPELPAPSPCDYPDRGREGMENDEGDSKERMLAAQREERSRRLNALEKRMVVVERAIRLKQQAAMQHQSIESPSSSTASPPPLDLPSKSSSGSPADSVTLPVMLPPPIASLAPSPTMSTFRHQTGNPPAWQQGSWQESSSQELGPDRTYAAGAQEPPQHSGTLQFQQQERAFQQPTPPIDPPRRPLNAGAPRITQADSSSSIYLPPPSPPMGPPPFTQIPLRRQPILTSRHSYSATPSQTSQTYPSPSSTPYSSILPLPRRSTNEHLYDSSSPPRRFSHPPDAYPTYHRPPPSRPLPNNLNTYPPQQSYYPAPPPPESFYLPTPSLPPPSSSYTSSNFAPGRRPPTTNYSSVAEPRRASEGGFARNEGGGIGRNESEGFEGGGSGRREGGRIERSGGGERWSPYAVPPRQVPSRSQQEQEQGWERRGL